ncbi:MAG: 30S ribosomal protein S8 [Cyanobacteria bacterium]|nr:30S ribosomal protein S8 [Cyanobacteriota bacterium]
MNTDPIADFLTRIRNACRVSLPNTEVQSSKLKIEMAKLLLREGYIRGYELRDQDGRKDQLLRVLLKYDALGFPAIRSIRRVSRPGLRKYYRVDNIPRILSGAGIVVLSTNKGLLTDRDARRERVGGEALCTIQ